MLLRFMIFPVVLSLTAANIFNGLYDYGMLGSPIWKYQQPSPWFQTHAPRPHVYYPRPPSPLWNVPGMRPYNPIRDLPKPDYDKYPKDKADATDVRSQSRFCNFFDDVDKRSHNIHNYLSVRSRPPTDPDDLEGMLIAQLGKEPKDATMPKHKGIPDILQEIRSRQASDEDNLKDSDLGIQMGKGVKKIEELQSNNRPNVGKFRDMRSKTPTGDDGLEIHLPRGRFQAGVLTEKPPVGSQASGGVDPDSP